MYYSMTLAEYLQVSSYTGLAVFQQLLILCNIKQFLAVNLTANNYQ